MTMACIDLFCGAGGLTHGFVKEGLPVAAEIRILAGCAPCQPFSTYSQRHDLNRNERLGLLYEFAHLAEETLPEIITMENVPSVQ